MLARLDVAYCTVTLLPVTFRAAFQYGVKMNDGRKTRGKGLGRNDKDEKAKLDRDWQKIQSVSNRVRKVGQLVNG